MLAVVMAMAAAEQHNDCITIITTRIASISMSLMIKTSIYVHHRGQLNILKLKHQPRPHQRHQGSTMAPHRHNHGPRYHHSPMALNIIALLTSVLSRSPLPMNPKTPGASDIQPRGSMELHAAPIANY